NPSSDSSFIHATSATRLYADPRNAPAGHIDLLTAIMHEMGHKLGLDDSYAETDRDNLMYGYLTEIVAIRLGIRSEEHTSELQSRGHLVCRLLLEKKKRK